MLIRKWPVMVLVGGLALLGLTGAAVSDDDDDDDKGWGKHSSRQDVAPVADERYVKECGSCHMAYQPGLLPERSWVRLMTTLDQHFGENAELPEQEREQLTRYLVRNAADSSKYKRSRKIMDSITDDNDMPLRISETPYIVRKHRELPARAVGPQAEVKSLGQCNACHRQAEKGSYNEHEVVIPGIGRWED